MMLSTMSLVLAAVPSVASQAIPPSIPHGVNLTLYHVNQKNYTGITDMNSGDVAVSVVMSGLRRNLASSPPSGT